MERKIVKRDPKKLKFDVNQPRKSFKMEDVKLLAETYKVHNIINNPEIDENNIVITGELRVRGAIYFGMSEIECILIIGLSKAEKKERQLIENIHRYELTSKEREDAISELWNSGRYKNQHNLADILGIHQVRISQLIKAKKIRDDLDVNLKGPFISTQTLVNIAPLPPNQQKQVLKKVKDAKLQPSKVREFVRTIKTLPSDVKEEVLKPEPTITIEEAKEIAEIPKDIRIQVLKKEKPITIKNAKEIAKMPEDVKKEVLKPKSKLEIDDAKTISEMTKPDQRKRAIQVMKKMKTEQKDTVEYMKDVSNGKIPMSKKIVNLDQSVINQFTQVYKQVIIKMTKKHIESYTEQTQLRLRKIMMETLRHLQKELNIKGKIIDV